MHCLRRPELARRWWWISLTLLASGVLAGCGSSTSNAVASKSSTLGSQGQRSSIASARACLASFNASRQAEPYAVLRIPITDGYVTTNQTIAFLRARCAVLLFIQEFPHRSALPWLFLRAAPTGAWHRLVANGSRASIPEGIHVDVTSPSDLRLAR